MNKRKAKLKHKVIIAIIIAVCAGIALFNILIKKTSQINATDMAGISKLPMSGGEEPSIDTNEDYGNVLGKTQNIENFDWERDIDPSIGSITPEENGKKVSMFGNGENPGKNCIYIIPDNHQEQEFSFNYTIDYGDSFIAAGVLIRIKKQGNNLVGYMISFNHSGHGWDTEAGGKLGGLWKVTFPLEQNTNNSVTKQLVKGLDLPESGNMKIKSNEKEIVITGSNINETITLSGSDYGDGFGFFTVHYDHSCNSIGKFYLENFAAVIIDILPHKLKIDPNGGTWKGNSSVQEETGVYKETRQIPIPVRDGYTFVKWDKTGDGGTMNTLTDDATYTFGENETDDKITARWVKIDVSKQSNIEGGKVTKGQKITYTITANNEGDVPRYSTYKRYHPSRNYICTPKHKSKWRTKSISNSR